MFVRLWSGIDLLKTIYKILTVIRIFTHGYRKKSEAAHENMNTGYPKYKYANQKY